MVKPIYNDIEYEEHKKYMRNRYHKIEYKIKNNIKDPPVLNIIYNHIILEF